MIRLEIKNYNKQRNSKISSLSPGKIDKYEYPKVEKILPSDQSRII